MSNVTIPASELERLMCAALERSASVSGRELRADVASLMEAIPDTDDALANRLRRLLRSLANRFADLPISFLSGI